MPQKGSFEVTRLVGVVLQGRTLVRMWRGKGGLVDVLIAIVAPKSKVVGTSVSISVSGIVPPTGSVPRLMMCFSLV